MPRRPLAGAGLRSHCPHAHAQHQRAHMQATNHKALAAQLPTQLACAHEGKLQVQFVHLAHQSQLGFVYAMGQVVRAISADAKKPSLCADRQVAVSVNHRFALSKPALVSAHSKKLFSSVSCPILACSDTRSTAG